MTDIIIVDSLGCVFNIRQWMNDCLATTLQMTGGTFVKKQFEELTANKFIDNYTDQINPMPSSDESLMYQLLEHRSARSIPLVEGTRGAFEQLAKLKVMPLVVIPAGFAEMKLTELCISKGLICTTARYRHPSNKFPSWVLTSTKHNLISIIDDSKATCSMLHDKGIPTILFDMPWNNTDKTIARMTSWPGITSIIEEFKNRGV